MKSILQLAGLCLLSGAATAHAQTLLSIPFDSDEDLQYFVAPVDELAVEPAFDNQRCLVIGGDVDARALKPIAVQALKKYKLTLRAAVDDSDTVETNDRLPEILAKNGGKSFAACQLTFFDKDGEETSFLLYGRIRMRAHPISIISGQLHEFVSVFYAPPEAETLQLKLLPRGRKVWIDEIVVERETLEGTENGNPDFRYGKFNLSGWDPGSEGRLYVRSDGTTVLKCGTSGGSSFFAVDDQARYSFHCKGKGYSKTAGKVTVSFYDMTGKDLGYTHLFWNRDMEEGATKNGIKPPPGAKLAMLKSSRLILEKVMVSRDRPATD
ncbi:hypothetical protein [Rosistilla oblonga]|uniref:Uncharacterized protein n=1 Tax=Rosistilla oblonga TaxID=2527990 RepID=A0A518J0M0_9BACT|nr:hypothetical protein [Rosistilla oblonga]QDV58878.1 hypothetical protein Mal33_49030 [Rosistilla oblonga]